MRTEDKEPFLAAMTAMFKAFNRDVDLEIVRLCFTALQHLDLQGAAFCISKAMMEEPSFPTLHKLRSYQTQIPPKEVPRVEYKNRYENMSGYAKKMVDAILDGKLSRNQVLDGMEVMEKQFPGVGWKEEAASLAAHYSRNERNSTQEANRYPD